MARRNVVIDAEDFHRRQGVAALLRASSLDVEQVPRRPNVAVWGGAVLALLIAAGSAGTAYATGRAPAGWEQDGSLVIDRDTGARFVAQDDVLRPVPSLTAALLAGADRDPVLVAHDHVSSVSVGAALAGVDLPERPPALPDQPTGLTGCLGADSSIQLFQGAPAPAPTAGDGVLVQTRAGGKIYLVTGTSAHLVSTSSLERLGYEQGQVRTVPAAWLALVPRGAELTGLVLPATNPDGGIPGLGAAGEVIRAGDSGTSYWIADAQVHPFLNRTSELLAPTAVATHPDAAVAQAPVGEAVGLKDVPAAPPTVPQAETVAEPCVRSRDGLTVVFTHAEDAATRAGARQQVTIATDDGEPGQDVDVVWHAEPGRGALLGPDTMDEPSEDGIEGTGGMRLIADGRSYEFVDTTAVNRLGYRREQTVKLPTAWLDLFPQGGTLSSSS